MLVGPEGLAVAVATPEGLPVNPDAFVGIADTIGGFDLVAYFSGIPVVFAVTDVVTTVVATAYCSVDFGTY